MRAIRKLSAKAVEKLKAPGRYDDGGGLVLQVSQWRAGEARKQLRHGIDPLAAKQTARVAQKVTDARSITENHWRQRVAHEPGRALYCGRYACQCEQRRNGSRDRAGAGL